MAITITNNTTLLNELKTKAESLPNREAAGVDVSGVTATASDVLSPKVFVDSTGVEQTGTIVTKTVDDLTAKTNTVTVPAGYYATQVSKSISTGTVNDPMFNVSASGLVTATVTTSAGYVTNISKQNTYQLPTQAAKIVTPSTTQQTAVASGKYTTGDVYVSGDSNLITDNIKNGVSIFGVTGTYADMAKVYVAKNIKPTAMGSGSTNRSFEISASGISKLIDASNSDTAFPSSLYGVRPMAVIIVAFSQYSTTASLCEAYFTDNTYKYGGALYSCIGNNVSTTTLDPNTTEYLSCNPNDSTGNVNIYVYVNKTYNFSTNASHNIYLIY